MTLDGAALELARDPGLRRLWDRVRRRLEADGARKMQGTLALADPTPEERRAVRLLVGTQATGRRLTVSLARLDAALRASALGLGAADLLERMGPPLRDRGAEGAASAEREELLWRTASAHRSLARHPRLAAWLDGLRASGRLRRSDADDSVRLLAAALGVLASLPTAGTGRAAFAGSLFGDAHALDDERPVAPLVLAALAHLEGTPIPSRASQRRALWERWGVLLDSVSSRILTCGLRLGGDGLVRRALDLFAGAGMPLHVTLGMLEAEAWTAGSSRVVFVCENPAVVEAASRRMGARCPAMACVEGMPSVAARRLLDGLRRDGVELLYHGDFGAGGLRIGNVVIGELGARPWRFGAAEYEAALASVRDTTPIDATVPDAVWDPALAPLLRTHRREVHEEQLLDVLLGDLRELAAE